MSFTPPNSSPPVHTAATCGSCGAATTVPFVPTPGRPVFCRDCFQKQRDARGGPGGGSGGAHRGPPRSGGGGGGYRGGFSQQREERPASMQRRRMMKQGAKAHFRYDLRAILANTKMDEAQKLSFAETVFSKGARMSSEDAMQFVDSKVADETLTKAEAQAINGLIHRYSMWR